MNTEAIEPLRLLRKALADLEAAARQAAESAAGGKNEAGERLRDALSAARSRITDAEQSLQQNLGQGAKAADRYVHENVWVSIGIAAAVAFIIGALTGRRD